MLQLFIIQIYLSEIQFFLNYKIGMLFGILRGPQKAVTAESV